jgi:hypothetical protein
MSIQDKYKKYDKFIYTCLDVCFDNLGECTRKIQMCDRSVRSLIDFIDIFQEYKRLLVKYCAKTCGFCRKFDFISRYNAVLEEALNRHAQYQIHSVYKGKCSDRHTACGSRQFMCHDRVSFGGNV